MSSVYQKRGRYFCRLKGYKVAGKWSDVDTGETDRDDAIRWAREAQRHIDRKHKIGHATLTLRDWIKSWLEKRREAGLDWKKDRGRLHNHVLPVLGDLELDEIATSHLIDLVHALRFRKKLANRTARNIYVTLAAALRDAVFAGKITTNPCILTEQQLGPIVDKDPEWRDGAVYTREEAEAMISDRRIPLDRQLYYGFGLLAGMRPGEIAALRFRHYDATRKPLGCLKIALAYSTSYSREKGTKTEATRSVPVHSTLAAMMAEWKLSGWAAMMGRPPTADDLILPLPPGVKRTKRTGERFRGWDYAGRRWRELDLPALGWRKRSVYDTKSTFITLAIEDGADRAIIRERVTHTKPRRDAFDGYDRGPHWIETCREVAKLKIRRLADTLLTPAGNDNKLKRLKGSGGGVRTAEADAPGCTELHAISGASEVTVSPAQLASVLLSARLADTAKDAEIAAQRIVDAIQADRAELELEPPIATQTRAIVGRAGRA